MTLLDSGAGTFTATYNAEGAISSESYPNGMTASYTSNPVGQITALTYGKGATTWYKDQTALSIHGQIISQQTTLANASYAYDNSGRMAEAQEEATSKIQEEAVGKGCKTLLLGYDAESDRISETAREPAAGGACASEGGTQTVHTYDEADHLTDYGVAYEAFGGNTTLPAADAGGHTLESAYYSSGALYSQTQNEQTNTYTLDPAGRVSETTTTKGINAKSTISHYSGTDKTAAWTETEGSWTRNVTGINGAIEATESNSGEPVFKLVNLDGDVIGTAALHAEAPTLTSEPTAFGVPTSTPKEKAAWLGNGGLLTEFAATGVTSSSSAYISSPKNSRDPPPKIRSTNT